MKNIHFDNVLNVVLDKSGSIKHEFSCPICGLTDDDRYNHLETCKASKMASVRKSAHEAFVSGTIAKFPKKLQARRSETQNNEFYNDPESNWKNKQTDISVVITDKENVSKFFIYKISRRYFMKLV